MEQNNITEQQINNNNNVEVKKFPISVAVLIGAQILAVVILAIMLSYGRGFIGLVSLFILPYPFIVFPLLGVWGLIQFAKIRKKHTHRIVSLVLLITSISMVSILIPTDFANKLSIIFDSIL